MKSILEQHRPNCIPFLSKPGAVRALNNCPQLTTKTNTDSEEDINNRRGSVGQEALCVLPTSCPQDVSASQGQKRKRVARGSSKNLLW